MLQYPIYSQMNNMYAQPNNPYAERMNFLQGYQQSLQQSIPPTPMPGTSQSAIGKIVDSMDAVKAIDIPMDGNIYYFPKADGTEIYGKQWQQDCTTRILTYKPVLDAEPSNISPKQEKLKFDLPEDVTEGIMKRFDTLESKFSDFENVLTKSLGKQPKTSAKRESETE